VDPLGKIVEIPSGPMRTITVCHIISGDLWAGAEVVVYHLLKHLRGYNDLNLSALLFNEGRLAEEIRSLDIPVDVVEESNRSFLRIVRETGKILGRRSPDVVHSHRYKENILSYLASISREGVRLLSTQHGMPEYMGKNRNSKYRILQRLNRSLMAKSISRVVVVSHDMRKVFLETFGFPENHVQVIRNGAELPEFIPSRKDTDSITIGSMGRMVPVKDYPLMVEIAREVCRETDTIRFELAGDGPDRGRIIEMIERYRLGDIFTLRGYVENLSDFYRGIDLYLNTSVHEGIPMSVLEAMSYGIPIIAPDVGGMREIVRDGIEGYLVDGREPGVFAGKCLALSRDAILRQSMGSSAREKVEEEFSNERMAREYYGLYRDIVHHLEA
jgi:glycosyltransferase involved in cell wall biosynthesis